MSRPICCLLAIEAAQSRLTVVTLYLFMHETGEWRWHRNIIAVPRYDRICRSISACSQPT